MGMRRGPTDAAGRSEAGLAGVGRRRGGDPEMMILILGGTMVEDGPN